MLVGRLKSSNDLWNKNERRTQLNLTRDAVIRA